MPDDGRNPNRTTELCEILWGYIQDFERVRHLKKRPSLDKLLRVAHAVSQLTGAYLKAAEAEAVLGSVPALQAQVQELLRESRNGHGHPAAHAELN
jgi:hypothetical protein